MITGKAYVLMVQTLFLLFSQLLGFALYLILVDRQVSISGDAGCFKGPQMCHLHPLLESLQQQEISITYKDPDFG